MVLGVHGAYGRAMPAPEQVYRITTAQSGLSAEQSARTRRYLISMAVRTICFIGAVVADGWMRWLLVAGAVALPYLAVVIANGGREPTKDDLPMFIPDHQTALPSVAVDHRD